MNKSLIKQIPICLLVFITGCVNKNTKSDDSGIYLGEGDAVVVNIDITKPQKLKDKFDSISTVNFDESVLNIIGIPRNIIVRGDTIYALDSQKSPGLYAYLEDGRQLFAYCSMGSGPKDINCPYNLNVTDTNISVFDTANKRIIVFDKLGNYKDNFDLPSNTQNAMVDSSGGIWLDYSNQSSDNAKLSWLPNLTSKSTTVINVPEYLKGMTIVNMQNFVKLSNGKILYMPSIEPKVFELDNGKACLKYRLDFNGLWPTEDEIKKEYSGKAWAPKFRKFPISNLIVQECDKWFVVGFGFEDNRYICIYDRTYRCSKLFVDDSDTYYGPKYVTNDELYLLRKDDRLEILELHNICN